MIVEAWSKQGRRRWIALVVVCIGQLMIVVDASIVNVALPAIQRDMHFSHAALTWVMDGYMISYGGFLLVGGRLGDLIGRKRVFLAGLVLFVAASAACGVADGQITLVAARFVQGLGGAVCAAVVVAIVATEFPRPAERATAMSVYPFVAVSGGTLGLLLGGAIVSSIDWHWIFFINVPIGVVTWVLGRALIEESEGIGLREGVDVLGAHLVTAALMVGVYAIVKSKPWFGAASAALLAAFVATELRVRSPMMPLSVLRLRSLSGSSVVRGLTASGLFTTFFLGALYLEHVRGCHADRPVVPADDARRRDPLVGYHRPAGQAVRRQADPGPRIGGDGRRARRARRGRSRDPVLPDAVRRVCAHGRRRRHLVHAAAAHRDGRRARPRRRPGLWSRQRLDVDRRRGRPGRPRRGGHRPHAGACRPRLLARGGADRRLRPRFRRRRGVGGAGGRRRRARAAEWRAGARPRSRGRRQRLRAAARPSLRAFSRFFRAR